MQSTRTPAVEATPPLNGNPFACIVNTSDAPVGSTEAELKRLGARVTRLLAPVLVPRRNLDGPTFRMLGHLYAGLVIPDNACRTSHEVSVVAGVPVVYESQGATGLIASVDVTGD